MAEIKETILVDVEVKSDQDDIAKLEKLKSGIVLLQKEQQDLTKAYKAGNITLKEFSEGSVRVSNNLKIQQSQFSNLQKSVTGVQSPFDKLNASINGQSALLDKLIPGLGSTTTALQTTATGAKSLWVSLGPVAIIIAVIGAALAILTNFLKSTGEGEDALAKGSAVLGSIMDNLSDIVNSLVRNIIILSDTAVGGAIISFLKLAVALNPIAIQFKIFSEVLNAIVPSFREAAKEAGRLADELDSIQDAERQYNIEAAQTELLIKNLIIQSKNRGISELDAAKKLQEADDLRRDLNEKNIEILNRKLQYEVDSIANANRSLELAQKENETLEEFALRVSDNNQLTDTAKDKIANALKAISTARGESLNLKEKIANQEEKIDIKRIASEEKVAAARKKTQEDEAKRLQKEADDRGKNFQIQLELDILKIENDKKSRQEITDQIISEDEAESLRISALQDARLNEWLAKKIAASEKEKKIAADLDDYNRSVLLNFRSILQQQLASGQDAGTAFLKSFLLTALSQLKLYFQAIILAQELSSKGIFGLIFAAAEIAIVEVAFAAASAAIQGFATGGATKISGQRITSKDGIPIRRSNGDNRIVTVGTDEAIINPVQIARLGGPRALKNAGVPGYEAFATGGSTGFSSFMGQTFDNQGIINAIRQMQVAVIIEEVEAKIQQRAQIKETATI